MKFSTKALAAAALLVAANVGFAQATAPAAAAAPSPAKKALIDKLIQLQQPGVEGLARQLVQQPLGAMAQGVGNALRQQPADKQEALGTAIQAEMRKFAEDAVATVRERGTKLAPTVWSPMLNERFTEDELKVLIAWLENPVSKKYQQVGMEMMNTLGQKMAEDARPVIEPRFKALDASIAKQLGITPPPAASAPAAKPAAPAKK